jgi:hypothetical protein
MYLLEQQNTKKKIVKTLDLDETKTTSITENNINDKTSEDEINK